jgi:hypothetical protein
MNQLVWTQKKDSFLRTTNGKVLLRNDSLDKRWQWLKTSRQIDLNKKLEKRQKNFWIRNVEKFFARGLAPACLHKGGVHVHQYVYQAQRQRPVHRAHRSKHVDAAHHGQSREPGVEAALHLAVDGGIYHPAGRNLRQVITSQLIVKMRH